MIPIEVFRTIMGKMFRPEKAKKFNRMIKWEIEGVEGTWWIEVKG
jgi:hypothetical protein